MSFGLVVPSEDVGMRLMLAIDLARSTAECKQAGPGRRETRPERIHLYDGSDLELRVHPSGNGQYAVVFQSLAAQARLTALKTAWLTKRLLGTLTPAEAELDALPPALFLPASWDAKPAWNPP